MIDDYVYSKGTENVAGVVYDGGAHRFDGMPGATPEFFAVATLLLDPDLSVRLEATMDFVRMLTDQGFSSEEITQIAMYNMHVIREAIWGLFVYAFWEKPGDYDEAAAISGTSESFVQPEAVPQSRRWSARGDEGGDVSRLNNLGHSSQRIGWSQLKGVEI